MKITLGLRSEILISLCILVVSGLLYAGVFLLKIAEKELIQERVQGTLRVLQSLTDIARSDRGGDFFLNEIEWLFRRLSVEADVQAYSLFNAELQEITASGSLVLTDDLRRKVRTGEMDVAVQARSGLAFMMPGGESDFFDICLPLVIEGSVEGVLLARFSLEGIAARAVLAQRAIFVLIFGFGGVLIAFGTYQLGRTVVRPVHRLMQATSQVAAGDLAVNLPVDGPREISELASSFNAMARALEESRAETQATISSLHQVNEDLARTRDSLVRSEKMAAVGHLAAGMAHEIGNPLGAAIGYLELMREELSTPERGDLLTRTVRELARIDRLVRDLLDFAAPQTAEPELFDPAAVAREAVEFLCHQGLFKDIEFEERLPPDLPLVRASRHKLLQVLINVLVNARDACPQLGGRIIVSGRSEQGRIYLSVQDNGCGLPPDAEKHIFDPFFTTKEPGKGRGLGLFFCHKVIEESGGHITVDRTVDRPEQGGTRFSIILPPAPEGHNA